MKPMEPIEPMQPMQPMEFKQTPRWWPDDLGSPSASGSQNDVEYAYFSGPRRLLIRQGSGITTYDTGDHHIQGISQAGDARPARFTSDRGPVDLSELKLL